MRTEGWISCRATVSITCIENYRRSDAEVRQSIWSGDANTFAWKGVPALTYDRDGFGMHTCHDEQRFLSAWELGRETDLIEAMVRRLADREAFASERKLPGEMEQELQRLFAEY